MKPRILSTARLSLPLATALAALLASQATFAAALTWDTSIAADGTITAGSGTWTNGTGNWNNGTTSVGINWANANPTNPDSATFAGAPGTYVVTVGGPITSGGMTFNTSGYTLSAASAQTITHTVPSATGSITLGSGVTATIGTNVTVTRASNEIITGAGTLNIGSADQTSTGARLLSTQVAASGTNTISIANGASVVVNAGGYFGQDPTSAYTASNQFGKAILIGSSGGGTLTVKSGGTVNNLAVEGPPTPSVSITQAELQSRCLRTTYSR